MALSGRNDILVDRAHDSTYDDVFVISILLELVAQPVVCTCYM